MFTEADFKQARVNLGRLAASEARSISIFYEVKWVAAPDAPSTFEALMAQADAAQRDCGTLKVSSLHCDNTIYLSHKENQQFRFWHDWLHFVHEADFSFYGELEVAAIHTRACGLAFGDDSPEARLMRIDTELQARYYNNTGRHVTDQLAFARAHFFCN